MQPLSLDKFDLFILKQMFPNFKLSIEQLMKNIEKQLLKELESLSKYDVRKYLNLEKTEPITNDLLLSCATVILFDFEYDELFYEIDSRLNDKLAKLQVEDLGIYQLTKYGLELYNRIGVHSRDRIREKIIRIKEITDLSTMKIKTIIAQEYESNHPVIVTLTQQNLKQAKFNYWEITKYPIYIKGIENEIGIFKTIFHFQFTPPPQLPIMVCTVLSLVSKNIINGDYLLKAEQNDEIYVVKTSQIEPFVSLKPQNWNYNEGMYESLRGGLKLRLVKPVLGTGKILGFDACEVIASGNDYFNTMVVNLVDMKLNTKDKDLLQVPIPGNRNLVLSWTDLENQLDMERKDILKRKNSFKRKGQDPMLVRVEGTIKKKEVMVENNVQKDYFYLEDPEIVSENF